MPSNNRSNLIKSLSEKFPDRVGMLNTPYSFKNPYNGIHALDNGCFVQFNQNLYFKALDKLKNLVEPLFVVIPDVVGCHDRTHALWRFYRDKVKFRYGYKCAFVAQNGCEPDLIPPDADWIFVGGTDPWKQESIHKFVGNGKPVHVGRVNGIGRLKYCESLGVASVDGTGWLRQRKRQFYDFIEYFEGERQRALFT